MGHPSCFLETYGYHVAVCKGASSALLSWTEADSVRDFFVLLVQKPNNHDLGHISSTLGSRYAILGGCRIVYVSRTRLSSQSTLVMAKANYKNR